MKKNFYKIFVVKDEKSGWLKCVTKRKKLVDLSKAPLIWYDYQKDVLAWAKNKFGECYEFVFGKEFADKEVRGCRILVKPSMVSVKDFTYFEEAFAYWVSELDASEDYIFEDYEERSNKFVIKEL